MSIVSPSGETQCIGPPADAGEEMALRIAIEVVGLDINNAPFVYVTWRNVAGVNEIAEPLGCVWINLVVIGRHSRRLALR
jgi:hypothetical protein